MTGTYTETSAKGHFLFTLAEDGKSLSGSWGRTFGHQKPAERRMVGRMHFAVGTSKVSVGDLRKARLS